MAGIHLDIRDDPGTIPGGFQCTRLYGYLKHYFDFRIKTIEKD
jgi:hypothetical protein